MDPQKENKMTEPVDKDGNPINNGGQPDGGTPAAAGAGNDPSKNPTPDADEAWWKEASEKHSFKSKEDVYKSWQEANKKISDQGDRIKNFELFQQNVVPVLDVVLNDEELMKQVKAKIENPDKIPTKPDATQKDGQPVEDPDTKKYLIEDIVRSFESRHGIDKLDADTQKEIKAKIGEELKKFTGGVVSKVSVLGNQMEDAFALAVAKDEKLKTLFATKEEGSFDYGQMPSSASGIDKDGNIKLTPEQEKVAERMPGGREAYIKGLKKVQGK